MPPPRPRSLRLAPVDPDAPSTHAQIAGLVALVAAVPRFWFAVSEHPPDHYLTADMAWYAARAHALLAGTPPTRADAYMPSGYPALVALVVRVTGDERALGAVQATLGSLTCALAYLLAQRLAGKISAGVVAGLACATWVPLGLYTGFALTETTFAFLLTLAALLLVRAEQGRLADALGAGAALGLAALVRTNVLAFVPLWLVYVAWSRPTAWPPRRVAALLAVAALPLLAASARNSRALGRLAGPASNGGTNFFLAHTDYRAVRFPEGDAVQEVVPVGNALRFGATYPATRHADDEGFFYREGLRALAARPSRLLGDLDHLVEGLGVGEQTLWPGWREHEGLLRAASRAALPLAVAPGMLHLAWLAWRRRLSAPGRSGRLVLGLFALSVFATLYAFLGDPRVRVPYDPIFLALSADAAVTALAALGARAAGRTATAPA